MTLSDSEDSRFEAQLNAADGLDHPTVFSCAYFYSVPRAKIKEIIGRVDPERRGQIGRKIVAIYRIPL